MFLLIFDDFRTFTLDFRTFKFDFRTLKMAKKNLEMWRGRTFTVDFRNDLRRHALEDGRRDRQPVAREPG